MVLKDPRTKNICIPGIWFHAELKFCMFDPATAVQFHQTSAVAGSRALSPLTARYADGEVVNGPNNAVIYPRWQTGGQHNDE